MTFLLSLVDLTGLPPWPHYAQAAAALHLQIDRLAFLRMGMGNAFAPCPRSVYSIQKGLLAIVEVRP